LASVERSRDDLGDGVVLMSSTVMPEESDT
jgi:hypothetical protein